VSGRVEQWLHGSERTPARTLDERVVELLEAVRGGAQRDPGESWDAASERHAEEFIVALCARFPGRAFEVCWPPAHDQPEKMLLQSLAYAEPRPGAAGEEPRREPVVLVERQRLRTLARRTTGYNYVFTVPGDARERLVRVAHYDTWRGPGADANTTSRKPLTARAATSTPRRSSGATCPCSSLSARSTSRASSTTISIARTSSSRPTAGG
jgi:hypothetical protein